MAAPLKMGKGRFFSFKSESTTYSASLPEANLLKIARKTTDLQLCDCQKQIKKELTALSESSLLKGLVSSSEKVLIICDDITRPTPTDMILPVLVKLIESLGVDINNQTILFANGSHRPMTEKEAFHKIGKDLWGKIRWLNHDWQGKLQKIGTTASGIPITINPLLLEYKCIFGIGSVFPHRYCGWSGGGKIIIPGVSGQETVSQTHWMPYYDKSITLGSVSNAAQDEIIEAAVQSGLSFLIQCVCDGDGNLVDIFANTPRAAHHAAIEKAKSIVTTNVPISDVIITQAWPEESDLWQAGKALYAAENIVRRGGHILVVADLAEGVGPHRTFAELIGSDEKDILMYRDRHDAVGLAAAAAYVTKTVQKKASVSFVTNSIHLQEMSLLTGLRFYKNLQVAIDDIMKYNHKLTFSILYEAPLMLPIPEGQ